MRRTCLAVLFVCLANAGPRLAVAAEGDTATVVAEDHVPLMEGGVAVGSVNRGDSFPVINVEAGRLVIKRKPYRWLAIEKTVPLSQADALFSEKIRLNPQDAGAFLARAKVRFVLERFDECAADCTACLRLEPNALQGFVLRSRAHLDQAEFSLGLADADRALLLDATNDEARHCRATALDELGRAEEAMRECDRRIEDQPSADAYIDRALLHRKYKRLAEAAEDAGKAIALEPDELGHHLFRASELNNLKKHDDALLDLNHVIERDPRHAQALLMRSMVHMNKQNYALAMHDLDEVQQIAPALLAEALKARAMVQSKQCEYAAAIRNFTEAILLRPNDLELLKLRGVALLESGQAAEALVDLDAAAALAPDDLDILVWRAKANFADKREDQAVADLDHITARDPENLHALCMRGLFHAKHARYDHALAEFDRALQHAKGDRAAVLCWRAAIYAQSERTKEAIADLSEAIALEPSQLGPRFLLAGLKLKSGDPRAAVADCDELCSKFPTSPEAFRGRASIFDELGEKSKADADRKMAAKLEAAAGQAKLN
ncbi:MAG: tetratricopeptide repeat protein [Pirellulales bacterium]